MANDTKKKAPAPRKMHFADSAVGFMGQTLCGKSGSRVRVTGRLQYWDNPLMAGGRRCDECAPGVEKLRAEAQAKVTP